MILTKFENNNKTSFEIGDEYKFNKIASSETKIDKAFCLSFSNDKDNHKLKLLVILSPILIASFDNGDYELEFLKKTIENSKYPYGLYPCFFKDFNKKSYLKENENSNNDIITEDIILNKDNTIDFYFNPISDTYLISLIAMVDSLIEDTNNREILLKYFDKMRDDIVINGRRSIIANGIQAFYLNKYVLVWMLDLFAFIKEKNPEKFTYLLPIYNLINNLKTPRLTK